MKQRLLGNTGLEVCPISFGASSIAGGVFGSVSECDAIRTVHVALDGGVNLIDVAPFYGSTRAEEVLGKALQSISRDRFLVSTKVGRYGDASFDFSRARTIRSVSESLQRLKLDYVDLIQVHDIEYGSFEHISNETIPTLHDVVSQGRARFVGVTGYPLKALERHALTSNLDVVLSYNHCSLNDTTLLGRLPAFQAKGLGIINAGALSQGLLTDEGPPSWHPAPDEVKHLCAEAAAFCRSLGSNISKLAVQFSTRNDAIATTIIGTAKPHEIEQALEWADSPVDAVLLGKVEEMLAPIKDLTWSLGRPENN